MNVPTLSPLKTIVEMRKPEMTKKTSTPMKPPGSASGNAWKTTTAQTATARRPSMSARYVGSELSRFYFVGGNARRNAVQRDNASFAFLSADAIATR